MVPRQALAALIIPALLTGCAAGSGSRLAIRPDSRLQTPTVAVEQIIAQNNRNAELVDRLYSETSVSGNFARFAGGVDGKLSIERQRNFHLKLEKPFTGSPIADLGSNDNEFWFWAKDSKDREILVGQYGAGGALPRDIPFQPDWIVEALGLHVIPPDEIVKTQPSSDPNTIVLVHHRDDGHGSTTIKRTYVDRATYRVKKHEFFSNDRRQALAVVTPSDYRSEPLPTDRAEGAATNVVLPHLIRIQLATRDPKENVNIQLILKEKSVRVNPKFTEEFREANFSVPKYEGYANRYLTDPPAYAAESSSRSYESRPAPTAGAGTGLGEPQPIGADETSLRWDDPMPLESDLPTLRDEPIGVESIVRPGLPTSPDGSSYSEAPRERRVTLGSGFQP